MKKIITALIIIGSINNSLFAWSLFSKKTSTQYAQDYCKKLERKLPMQLDNMTTYTKCYNKKNVVYDIVYIDTSKNNMQKLFRNKSFIKNLKKNKEDKISQKICPESYSVLESILLNKHNVKFVLIFKEKKTKRNLFVININKNTCKKFLQH